LDLTRCSAVSRKAKTKAAYSQIRPPSKTATSCTLECELLARRRFASQAEAEIACFSYLEGFYNPVRLHSALGYKSPIAYEQEHSQKANTEA
jgi:transposase InsO family protein